MQVWGHSLVGDRGPGARSGPRCRRGRVREGLGCGRRFGWGPGAGSVGYGPRQNRAVSGSGLPWLCAAPAPEPASADGLCWAEFLGSLHPPSQCSCLFTHPPWAGPFRSILLPCPPLCLLELIFHSAPERFSDSFRA